MGADDGYDVADPSRRSEDLGGPAAYERACEALEDNGIGQLWDIVPNHMAASEFNPEASAPDGIPAYIRYEDCIECGLCLSACPIAATTVSGGRAPSDAVECMWRSTRRATSWVIVVN